VRAQDPADNRIVTEDELKAIEPDVSIGAVMCGFDVSLNYLKLAKATRYLRENDGCHLIITHDGM
jgi:4-nitrophenyl phosphatase